MKQEIYGGGSHLEGKGLKICSQQNLRTQVILLLLSAEA